MIVADKVERVVMRHVRLNVPKTIEAARKQAGGSFVGQDGKMRLPSGFDRMRIELKEEVWKAAVAELEAFKKNPIALTGKTTKIDKLYMNRNSASPETVQANSGNHTATNTSARNIIFWQQRMLEPATTRIQ